jgi:hypothetical protein
VSRAARRRIKALFTIIGQVSPAFAKNAFPGGYHMKSIALVLLLLVTSASLGGCFMGKGKTPVYTRG